MFDGRPETPNLIASTSMDDGIAKRRSTSPPLVCARAVVP